MSGAEITEKMLAEHGVFDVKEILTPETNTNKV
jgi:hypothetical protein